jgi:hypothetical protein
MSYDLYLFRPRPGVDPRTLVEELRSADGGLVLRKMLAAKDPAARQAARSSASTGAPPADAEHRRLSELLRKLSPELAPSSGSRAIQLTHRGLGIQLTFEAEHVAVAVPYSHREDQAKSVFTELSRYVAALEREGGLETYDPQLGRVVRLPNDVDDVVTVYARAADTAMNPTLPRRKPWWRPW